MIDRNGEMAKFLVSYMERDTDPMLQVRIIPPHSDSEKPSIFVCFYRPSDRIAEMTLSRGEAEAMLGVADFYLGGPQNIFLPDLISNLRASVDTLAAMLVEGVQ